LPEKGNAFLRPSNNKGFEEEGVTTMRLNDLSKSTTLESNKRLGAMQLFMCHDNTSTVVEGHDPYFDCTRDIAG
jgi:hypothetical protein